MWVWGDRAPSDHWMEEHNNKHRVDRVYRRSGAGEVIARLAPVYIPVRLEVEGEGVRRIAGDRRSWAVAGIGVGVRFKGVVRLRQCKARVRGGMEGQVVKEEEEGIMRIGLRQAGCMMLGRVEVEGIGRLWRPIRLGLVMRLIMREVVVGQLEVVCRVILGGAGCLVDRGWGGDYIRAHGSRHYIRGSRVERGGVSLYIPGCSRRGRSRPG
jgi:hypothetical protein